MVTDGNCKLEEEQCLVRSDLMRHIRKLRWVKAEEQVEEEAEEEEAAEESETDWRWII